MRILIVGAGAIGGYFGGRMLEAGRDVTFLVRPARAQRLAETGLVIRSASGTVTLPKPPTLQAADVREPFDLVLLGCKAYDLEGAMDAFAPAVGPRTAILPLLNGMRHLDMLDAKFGAGRVLGGLCVISSTLGAQGEIEHLNDLHTLVFGERDGSRSPRIQAIGEQFAGFDAHLSTTILQEMWEKWVFIATAGGINCLLRGTVGDMVEAGAEGLALELLEECAAIAAGQGFPPRDQALLRARAVFTLRGSAMSASMLRDVERGAPTEAEQILGDLLRRGESRTGAYPLLRIALAHLQTYEARRAREAKV